MNETYIPKVNMAVLWDVARERERQDEKWGEQNHDQYLWLAILGEEVGEACQAALNIEFESYEGLEQNRVRVEKYRDELIQVAAVAVAIVECLDRNGGSRGDQLPEG